MKILYANKYFFRNGGSETVMFDEIALMESMGIQVIHFSMDDPRNLPSPTASHFVGTKSYHTRSISEGFRSAASFVHSPEAVRKISALIEAERPDVLHCHNIYHQLTPSIISAAARHDVPVVLTLHDLKVVCPIYTQIRDGRLCTECSPTRFENVLLHKCGGYSPPKRLLLWLEARYHQVAGSYQDVSTFIAPSRFLRDAVASRFPADRIEYMPNGIDLTGIRVSPFDEGYVLYLGRIARDKGVDTLLQVHADEGATWRLVLAGTGPELEEYKSRFPQAEFAGFLSGDALQSCIDAAAVVVAPSEVQENCPMSIIKAMAHGKPMVASRIGGIPELVRHGETGFLIEAKDRRDMANRIRTLLENADLRKRFGSAGREVIENEYTMDGHGHALVSLYTRLSRERKRSAGTFPSIPLAAGTGPGESAL